MYGIYANIGDILMVNVTIYTIHGSYGLLHSIFYCKLVNCNEWNLQVVNIRYGKQVPLVPSSLLVTNGTFFKRVRCL